MHDDKMERRGQDGPAPRRATIVYGPDDAGLWRVQDETGEKHWLRGLGAPSPTKDRVGDAGEIRYTSTMSFGGWFWVRA